MGLIILYSLCAAFVLVECIQIGYQFNALLKFKPFTCTVCMSGWIALLLCAVNHELWHTPFIMAVAMTATAIFQSIWRRL